MSNTMSVYKQLKTGTTECLGVIKREIGMKSSCAPFAVKLIEALNTLKLQTEEEELTAANTLLSGIQTLMQGGIVAEDYDKIDFVKRGKSIVPSARVEAFLRAAARKGYRITDTIIAVPKEDFETTYFKEIFYNGDVVYTLEDRRYNPDRAVNAQRLIDKYFAKFICRLDIHDIKQNKRVAMTICEISIGDMMAIASTSEQGLYKSEWVDFTDNWGRPKRRKVIKDEINEGSFWVKWTGEMVNKTIIRRALKRVKEVLPELNDSIYAFEQDEYIEPDIKEEPLIIDIPIEEDNVNLDKLTAEQQADYRDTLDMFKANPKLAEDKFEEIKQLIEQGVEPREIINQEYASLSALRHSKAKWAEIGGYFENAAQSEA